MEKRNERDPMLRYTHEEYATMPIEDFEAILQEHNKYVRQKYARLAESNEPEPEFNSIEELMEYYDAIPMEDVINNVYNILN